MVTSNLLSALYLEPFSMFEFSFPVVSPTSPKWLRKWLRKFANSFTYFTYIVSVTRMLAAGTKMESGEGTNISKR